MAKIVMTYNYTILNGGNGSSSLNYLNLDRVFSFPALVMSSLSLATGSERFGSQTITPSQTSFGFSAVLRESINNTSYNDELNIKYSGSGFSYEEIARVAPIPNQPYVIAKNLNAGTVTSIEASHISSTYSGNSGGSNNITVTITDIAIAATELDPVNFTSMLSRVTTGNDQIFGSLLNDNINAGTGDDQVYGYDGNDTIYGGDGNDYLVGENGDDLLFGGDGNDWLIGGAGNDWLVGGAGYDTLIGGDGDDGIVFDPNDNLAGYSGGAGYDTLFIDWAAGGNPRLINLAAQGFEQAIENRKDTTNQPWSEIQTIYDNQWRITAQEFYQDDGSYSVWRYDASNSQSWKEIREYYTADKKLDYQTIYNDDNSTTFIDFDVANVYSWYSRTMVTSTTGKVISDTFQSDASITSRQTAMLPVKANLPEVEWV